MFKIGDKVVITVDDTKENPQWFWPGTVCVIVKVIGSSFVLKGTVDGVEKTLDYFEKEFRPAVEFLNEES